MLFFFVMSFMGLTMSFAQVPLNERLTYQTVLRNAQNQLVFNQNNVSVTVYVCNLDGTIVRYSETHTGLSTNPNGLLTLMVGGGTPASGAWNDIIWTDASIKTVISYDPGTGMVTITSDSAPVNAVPFALSTNIDCSVVVNCVNDAIGNGASLTNTAIDTIINNHLTSYQIKNCSDVTDCVGPQIHDSLVAHPVYNSTITFHQEGETDQSITLNQSTTQTINIATYVQKSARFTATAGQTDFPLSGGTPDADGHLVQMYINGVYVGDNQDGVVNVVSGTTAQYQPGSNNDYALVAGDRVQFVYWVK